MAGAALAGGRTVLGTRQLLAVNLVSDALPAIAVAAQPPLERDRAVRREGTESFDQRLIRDVLGALAGSGGMLALALALPPLRRFLGLPRSTPQSLLLSAATAPAAVIMAGAR